MLLLEAWCQCHIGLLSCLIYAYVLGAKDEAAEAQGADILSQNFTAYQKFSVYVEPVLGTVSLIIKCSCFLLLSCSLLYFL